MAYDVPFKSKMAVRVLENYKKEYEKRLEQLTLKNIASSKGVVTGVTVPGGYRRGNIDYEFWVNQLFINHLPYQNN